MPDTGSALKIDLLSEFFMNDHADSCYRRRKVVLRDGRFFFRHRDLSEDARHELFRVAQSARGVIRARDSNPSAVELKVGMRLAAI